LKEKYGNKSNGEKESLISNGSSIKIDITIKKCGVTLKRK
jgi:hypothetical protein